MNPPQNGPSDKLLPSWPESMTDGNAQSWRVFSPVSSTLPTNPAGIQVDRTTNWRDSPRHLPSDSLGFHRHPVAPGQHVCRDLLVQLSTWDFHVQGLTTTTEPLAWSFLITFRSGLGPFLSHAFPLKSPKTKLQSMILHSD